MSSGARACQLLFTHLNPKTSVNLLMSRLTPMAPDDRLSAFTASRRLRSWLRQLREQRYTTQRELGEMLEWSPSKVMRIERGDVTIARSDLLAMCIHFEVGPTIT